jgi:HEAT repeat protein
VTGENVQKLTSDPRRDDPRRDAFAWIGPDARPALPLLLRAATNSNKRVRANALWALGEIQAEPNSCVPALLQGLNDPDAWVQTSAAHALGMFGPDASVALPALAQSAQLSRFSGTSMSRSSFAQVHIEALRALRKIDPSAASSTNGNFSARETSDPASQMFPQ